MELAARILSICIALAGVEMLHGIVRVRFLVPRVGRQAAQRISILTGSALAFTVCWLLVPTLGLRAPRHLLLVGALLSVFMASFDIAVARWLMRRSWASIPEDFDPRQGNYLLYGLIFLVLAPYLAIALRAGA